MAAGQVARDAADGADLVDLAAVGALALVEDHRAHGLLLELLELSLDLLAAGRDLLLGELGEQLVLDRLNGGHAGLLVGVVQRLAHLVATGGEDAVAQRGVGLVELHVHGSDLELAEERFLDLAELADGLLREHERLEHVLLGHLVAARPRS